MKAFFFLVHLALAGLAVWQGYHIFKTDPLQPASFAHEKTPPSVKPSAALNSQGSKIRTLKQMEAVLVQRNLFKAKVDSAAPKKSGPPKPADMPAPEKTTLDLTLWGTVAGNIQDANWAVIENKKQHRQDLYKTGDTIMGARIKQITRNRVILTLNGKDQMLEAQTKTLPAAPASMEHAPKGPGDDPGFIQNQNDFNDPAGQDPQDMLGTLKSRPYMKGGSPSGLLVYGIRPGSHALAVGLRNGDIIKSINDMDVNSAGDLKEAAGSLESDGEITITLSRRGREKQIVYKGADE